MKKILFLPLSLILFTAVAQQESRPLVVDDYFKARIIKVNLLSPLLRIVTVGYESTLTPGSSIHFTVSLINNRSALEEDGYIVTPEYRFYLSATPAPKGTYVAPFFQYASFDDETAYGGGLIVGRQGFYKKRVTIDAFIGPAFGTLGGDGDVIILPRGGLTLGINMTNPDRR